MLPDKLKLEILTPERSLFQAEVDSVRVPGLEGYFGVFPGHAPFIAALKPGTLKVDAQGKTSFFALSGGFSEVLPDSVSILAESSEAAEQIDIKRAEAARDRAQKRIKEGRQNWDVKRAQDALARALARLHAASAP